LAGDFSKFIDKAMRQFSLIFILSFFLQNTFGQVLTKAEAYAFADKLLEVEILSERGRNMLKMQIDLNQNGNQPLNVESSGLSSASFKKSISISYVLDFCFFAFQNEQAFRMGVEEFDEIAKKYEKDHGKKRLNEEDFQKINKIFNEKSKDIEGFKIEENIVNEEENLKDDGLIRGISFGKKMEKRLIHTSRSVMGKTRSRTANDLFRIGLINEKVLDDIVAKIKLKELNSELAVVGFAKEQIHFYENLPIRKEAELKILNNLKRVEILSEATFQELTSPKNAGREFHRFEIFASCKNAKVLKNNQCLGDPIACFQNALDEIKVLIPGLDYEKIDYRIDERSFDWNENLFFLELKIQLDLDGKTYRSSSMQGSVDKKENPNWTLDSLNINYRGSIFRMANKILANRNSPKRLYSIFEGGNDRRKKLAIMLMTENEFKAWDDPYGMYFYPEDHNNFFTIIKLNELIDEYKLIGLLDHLTKKEMEEGRKKVHETMIYSYSDILINFPNLVVDFDWEYGNMTNPYEELTTEFAKASKGNFKPENIKDGFSENIEKANTTFSFEISGKEYKRELEMMGDWLDQRFLYLIDDAIKDNQVDGKFYDCVDDIQDDGYIFLTNQQFEFLQKNQPELFYKYNSHD
jgi:hypothetical protein